MSSRRPLIGLVAQHNSSNPDQFFVKRAYVQAVSAAGGIPIMIPPQPPAQLEQLLSRLQGLVLTGGVDVHPELYGEELQPWCGEISQVRDELDFAAAAWALQHDMPLLAICRGIQVLNVAFGGSLYQDIPQEVADAVRHWQSDPGSEGTHEVTVHQGTLLSSLVGRGPLPTNSFHHQGIKRLGSGLKIAATTPDQLVEAVESPEHRFVLGVQWHPELMAESCPAARALFEGFVRAAEGE